MLIIIPFIPRRHERGSAQLYLRLLRDFQGIIEFDAQVSDRALQLATAQKQLNRSKVLRPLVDQRRFGAPHGVSAGGIGVEPHSGNPLMNDPCVLPR